MTSDGSPHTRLRRAIQAGNLAIIQVTAAELGYVTLRDALGILLVIESEAEERFDAAAVRWAGRFALETPDLELAELRGALESLDALPDEHAQRVLFGLAERARPARAPLKRRAHPRAPRQETRARQSRGGHAVVTGFLTRRARVC